ncbi:hypothetical protein ACH4L5_08235 [Streptomyces sp. NPDC017405]|uniref:hypothetical protein n=1 Tax=unclassified Streptomyces TaxID=2593676 RepID=UPI00378D4C6D
MEMMSSSVASPAVLASMSVLSGPRPKLQVVTGLGAAGQDGVEVADVEDVVGHDEVEDLVPLRQGQHLGLERLRRLAAALHRGPVQPAERAVVLLSPPAAPRAFDHQLRLVPPGRHAGLQALEVRVVTRRGHRRGRQIGVSMEQQSKALARISSVETSVERTAGTSRR